MTDSYLPIAAQINSRAVSRDDVLAWEGPRAAKVARRLGIRGDHNRVELTRQIMNRKLELGYDALEAMLRRDARISDTGSRLGAALSRGRRNVATTVLTCDTGTAETIPDWYRTAFVADDDRPMLAASPDHWIFRHRADGRDEVVETAAASPVVVQMFFDEHNRALEVLHVADESA